MGEPLSERARDAIGFALPVVDDGDVYMELTALLDNALAAIPAGETEPISALLDELAVWRRLWPLQADTYRIDGMARLWKDDEWVDLDTVDPEAAALLDRLAGESDTDWQGMADDAYGQQT